MTNLKDLKQLYNHNVPILKTCFYTTIHIIDTRQSPFYIYNNKNQNNKRIKNDNKRQNFRKLFKLLVLLQTSFSPMIQALFGTCFEFRNS